MPAVEIIDFHDTKYWKPEKAFTKPLESIGTKEINGVKELCLNFGVEANADGEEIPCDLVIRGINKLKEDGHVSDYFDMGKFIKSARALGLKPMLEENGTISFTPSPIGKMVTMSPENPAGRKVTGADGKENVYYSWIMTAVAGFGNNPNAVNRPSTVYKEGQKEQAKADATAMTEKWKELLAEHLTQPENMAGLIRLLNKVIPDAATRKPYSDTRPTVIPALVSVKFLTIDGDGKYSVA